MKKGESHDSHIFIFAVLRANGSCDFTVHFDFCLSFHLHLLHHILLASVLPHFVELVWVMSYFSCRHPHKAFRHTSIGCSAIHTGPHGHRMFRHPHKASSHTVFKDVPPSTYFQGCSAIHRVFKFRPPPVAHSHTVFKDVPPSSQFSLSHIGCSSIHTRRIATQCPRMYRHPHEAQSHTLTGCSAIHEALSHTGIV